MKSLAQVTGVGPRFEARQSGCSVHQLLHHAALLPSPHGSCWRLDTLPSPAVLTPLWHVAHAHVTHRHSLSLHTPTPQVWGLIHSFYKYSVRRYHLPRARPGTGTQRRQCPQGASLLKQTDQGSVYKVVGGRGEETQGSTGQACTSLGVKVGFLEEGASELGPRG